MRYPENSFQKYAGWRVEDIFEDEMSRKQPEEAPTCDRCVHFDRGNCDRFFRQFGQFVSTEACRRVDNLCGLAGRFFERRRQPFNYAEAERQIREFTSVGRRQQWQDEINRRIKDEARRRQVSRQQVRNDYSYPPDNQAENFAEIRQWLQTGQKPAPAKPVEDDPILKPSKRKFNL